MVSTVNVELRPKFGRVNKMTKIEMYNAKKAYVLAVLGAVEDSSLVVNAISDTNIEFENPEKWTEDSGCLHPDLYNFTNILMREFSDFDDLNEESEDE